MSTTRRELRWVQPDWKHRKYELKDGGRTIARLEHRGSWKPLVYIVLDEEELVLRGRGTFRTKIVVMRGDQEIARFEQTGQDKNYITFITGRRFRWARQGFWSSTYSFVAADNEVLMTFKSVHRFLRSEVIVTLSPSGEKYPEARILMALGVYLIQSAAAAIAATAG